MIFSQPQAAVHIDTPPRPHNIFMLQCAKHELLFVIVHVFIESLTLIKIELIFRVIHLDFNLTIGKK